METKMITIPFDVERAKRIQAGEEPGKITIRAGRRVRIVCWDMNDENYPIAGIITNYDGRESIHTFTEAGRYSKSGEDNCDLCLLIPEWTQYKDGDVLVCEEGIGKRSYSKHLYILKDNVNFTEYSIHFKSYVSYDCNPKDEYDKLNELEYDDGCSCLGDSIRIATDEEKQKLIDALKASTDPRGKEYLKRFFGIEEKQECEFEPFQQVLVRDDCKRRWICALFNFYDRRKETSYPFVCIGGSFRYCIPYNEQTKHLLGTTDNWEE